MECLALKWSDVDWINVRLLVERGIVAQNVDEVKTTESRKRLVVAEELLDALKAWKQRTEFSEPGDWALSHRFRSSVRLGPTIRSGAYQKVTKAAGIGGIGTHTLRPTFRSWLDPVGTPVGVQQRLMRHSDIRTTVNVYGDAVSADMQTAHSKLVSLALNCTGRGISLLYWWTR